MKAVLINSDASLSLAEVPDPTPGPDEILIEVAAASVNRADLAQREGRHDPGLSRPDQPLIAGMDAAGVVAEVGSNVASVQPGDRVMGLVSGGYAEKAILDARLAIPVPDAWTLVEGAAAVSGLQTEYDALANAAQLQPGEAVVIHGASAPVGLTGIQIARHLGAATIIATTRAGRADTELRSVGADVLVRTRDQDLSSEVFTSTGDHGADVIIDHVGGTSLPDTIRCLALEGRLVSVGRLGGAYGQLDLESLAYKRARIIGVTFRTRSIAQYADIAQAVAHCLLPTMEQGGLRPILDRIYPLEQAERAHARLAANEHRGKIVLTTGN